MNHSGPLDAAALKASVVPYRLWDSDGGLDSGAG
jgi:hypothetical protein